VMGIKVEVALMGMNLEVGGWRGARDDTFKAMDLLG